MAGAPGPEGASKLPPPPRSLLLADAKVTIRAPIPRVFEALLNAEQLAAWWAQDVRVEAELGGRYEGTLAEGRVEGTITGIDGPGKLSFKWLVTEEAGTVETSVAYGLSPKGAETFVHVVHRSPKTVAGDWAGLWNRGLANLKAFLEAAESAAESASE